MESFISRKKRKLSHNSTTSQTRVKVATPAIAVTTDHEDTNTDEPMDTDTKLAILASLHPDLSQNLLFEALITADGSITQASTNLSDPAPEAHPERIPPSPNKPRSIGQQTSLPFSIPRGPSARTLTRKGQTLHLYAPSAIAAHTPCSLIPSFLPPQTADRLLRELLAEAKTFERATFKLFDTVVQSPHSACFYVSDAYERERQTSEYVYNGSSLEDVRELTPVLKEVRGLVREAVNAEIGRRVEGWYPGAKKLRFQNPEGWEPNAAFVNCYDGGKQSVGYHSDQLTYLGPRAVIGSISLGVAREFRVRKIVPKDDEEEEEEEMRGKRAGEKGSLGGRTQADEQGQIAIHLPHNSLLVMHAEMQEEWKHSIAPAQAIDPHPVAGNKRINITYRHYREELHPKLTPRCRCDVATVLRCVQKQKANRGKYIWQCHAGNAPGKDGCNFIQWAQFDDDGHPPWSKDFKAESTHDIPKQEVPE